MKMLVVVLLMDDLEVPPIANNENEDNVEQATYLTFNMYTLDSLFALNINEFISHFIYE